IRGPDAKRRVVRAGLDHDRIAIGEASVDHHSVTCTPADRGDRADLECRVGVRELTLLREVRVLVKVEELAQLPYVEPIARRNHGADVSMSGDDDDRLRDLVWIDPQRPC